MVRVSFRTAARAGIRENQIEDRGEAGGRGQPALALLAPADQQCAVAGCVREARAWVDSDDAGDLLAHDSRARRRGGSEMGEVPEPANGGEPQQKARVQ